MTFRLFGPAGLTTDLEGLPRERERERDIYIYMYIYIYTYLHIYAYTFTYLFVYSVYMSVRRYSLYKPVPWTNGGGPIAFAGFGADENRGIALGGSATI